MNELHNMVEFIASSCRDLGVSEPLLAKLDLATEEALVNIIHYAYPNTSGDLRISVSSWNDINGVEIRLEDDGIEFDPIAKTDPDISMPPELRPIGGLGIYLIRKTMDEVHYARVNGSNVFTLRKMFQ